MAVDSHATELEAVNRHVEAIARELAALKAANSRNRSVRLLLFLAFFAFVTVTCLGIYRLYTRMTSKAYLDQVQAAAEKYVAANQKDFQRQLDILVNNTKTPISDAFTKQVNKDMPGFMRAFESEREQFVTNLQTKLSDRLSKHYEDMLARNDKILKKEFPGIDNEVQQQKVAKNLQIVMNNISKKYYADELGVELNALFDTWDKFPEAEGPSKNEGTTMEQFIGSLLQLLTHKLSRP